MTVALAADGTPASRARQTEIVAAHYDDEGDYYLSAWHPRHLHFGLFEPGDEPVRSESGEGDWLDRSLIHDAVERMIEAVIAPAGIGAGQLVVDAGCGVGGTALRLAATRGCRVVGLNVSERQMEIARELAAEDGLGHLAEFRHADCSETLPLPDGSVDAVVTMEAMCHMADRERFLRECARVLKPGGRLVGSDHMMAAGLAPESVRTYIAPVCASWMECALEDADSLGAKVRAAGLDLVEIEDLSGPGLPNARVLAVQAARMRRATQQGALPSGAHSWMDRLDRMSRAWSAGRLPPSAP